MLQKTHAIVLSYLRYRETSVIVRMYTDAFGLQSYLVHGARTAKGKTNRMALFQPLTMLEMVVFYKEDRDLHRLNETKVWHPLQHIPFEVTKATMALFVSEMLSKVLQEETPNPQLFRFLAESVLYLEETPTHYENFHLGFLLKLSHYLGFGPESARAFEAQLREHSVAYVTDARHENALNTLLRQPMGSPVDLHRAERNELLDAIVSYYKIHVDTLGEVKSLPVLREVLS